MQSKKGPWTVTGSKKIYENAWMSLREDQVIRPDGKKGIYGVVTIIPGVTVVALDDQKNVYLTKEYHYAVEEETLEAVSGGIENGEDPLVAAKRELVEETGITATEWIDLGYVHPFTSTVNCPNYLYLAKKLTFAKQHTEGTEQITVIKMSFDEAVKLVMENKITHSASAALVLKIKLLT